MSIHLLAVDTLRVAGVYILCYKLCACIGSVVV